MCQIVDFSINQGHAADRGMGIWTTPRRWNRPRTSTVARRPRRARPPR